MKKQRDGRMFNAEYVAQSLREAVEFGRVWPEIKPPLEPKEEASKPCD